MTAYHCSSCCAELSPYVQTRCPKSESGLHSINDADFKAIAEKRQHEFQKQLDTASARADKLPDWAKKEAGLPTFEPSDTDMLDYLGNFNPLAPPVTFEAFFGRWSVAGHKGATIREAIRAAMEAEAEAKEEGGETET